MLGVLLCENLDTSLEIGATLGFRNGHTRLQSTDLAYSDLTTLAFPLLAVVATLPESQLVTASSTGVY